VGDPYCSNLPASFNILIEFLLINGVCGLTLDGTPAESFCGFNNCSVAMITGLFDCTNAAGFVSLEEFSY